jgi:aryl-alcohol dehydrogenase-like predicted oxidoreductase
MDTRSLGLYESSAIGLGCMSLSHAYGVPPPQDQAARLLLRALELGYTHLDTAALYGFGANERLLGEVLTRRRGDFLLATKGGMFGVDGKRVIDGRPETVRKNLEDSLRHLQTDFIDLYYLHRWDKRVPVEESVGELARMVREGKVLTIGLCEVSATTIRRAHAVHPITAVQTEYSLWTRNPEVAVLDTCRELGIALVAFSPLGRGFLTGQLRDVSTLPAKDIRLAMPRFQGEHFANNLRLLDGLSDAAREQECTMGQLALAWVLAQGGNVIPIPGTTRLDHLEENVKAVDIRLSPATINTLNELINPKTVSGARYNEATQAEIDTEEIGG